MFFDFDKVTGIRQQIEDLQSGIVIVYGVGAAYLCEHPDLLIYADMEDGRYSPDSVKMKYQI